MKTYIMENVLWNYTPGIIVVKAKNREKAMRLIRKAIPTENFVGVKGVRRSEKRGTYIYPCSRLNCFEHELRELGDNEVAYEYGGA